MSVDYGQKYETKRDQVLSRLIDLEWHSWQALRGVGGVRYSARLLELKRIGYQIEDKEDSSGHGKAYRLQSKTPTDPQQKRVKVFLDEADVIKMLDGSISPRAQSALRMALGSFQHNRHKL